MLAKFWPSSTTDNDFTLPPAIVHITHDESNDVDEDDEEPTYEVCGPRYVAWSSTSRKNNKGAAVVIQNVSANHNYRNISRDNGRGTDFATENVSANHNYQNISLANGRGSDFATENVSANHDYQNISRDNARASDFATENVLANHEYQNV
ncbi:hypothetical protein BaRGS_00019081 [Batillaria attramentaria]|uniref:Uncharacterized protein n=1 Tax=Batillaria attramentaria TaxID=370345 RepID=A0ABD0KQX0_9CAEN